MIRENNIPSVIKFDNHVKCPFIITKLHVNDPIDANLDNEEIQKLIPSLFRSQEKINYTCETPVSLFCRICLRNFILNPEGMIDFGQSYVVR